MTKHQKIRVTRILTKANEFDFRGRFTLAELMVINSALKAYGSHVSKELVLHLADGLKTPEGHDMLKIEPTAIVPQKRKRKD